MRDSKNIQLLKKTHGAPFAVKGIVDSGKLLNYYFNNESDVIQKNTGPKVLKIEKDHLLLRPILESMQEKLLSFEVRYAHFFDVTDPHIIHKDDEFEFPHSYKAFTIPLNIYGESDNIKLITFDQYYYGGPAKFFYGEKSIENVYYNTPITSYEDVQECSDAGIEQNIKDEYLGHLSDSWLQGLTVNKMLDWTIGDILCFDSLSLHCSSNFKSKKIDRKIGLSIFTVLTNDTVESII